MLVAFFGDAAFSPTLKFNLHGKLFSVSLVGREIEIGKGKKKKLVKAGRMRLAKLIT